MLVRDVLVHVDGGAETGGRVAVAARLAAALKARLTGLCVRPPLEVPLAAQASGDTRLAEVLERATIDGVNRVYDLFERVTAAVAADRRWLVVEGEAGSAIAAAALHSDLVVVGPFEAERAGTSGDSIVIASGAPTLVVPPRVSAEVPPRRVLVAWNGGREAARALRDALPLLRIAEEVEIVIVAHGPRPPDTGRDEPGAALLDHLALHGVTARVAIVPSDPVKGVAALVMERAGMVRADLIVMGGYGRSCAREVLVGSTTHKLLARAPVPILMAH